MMSGTELLAPRNRRELADALRRATGRSCLLAGGTDWMIEWDSSGAHPDLLIDLSRLEGAAEVRTTDGMIRVGALMTCAQLQQHEILLGRAACLAQAARQVGSLQIRNAATIGGNVANASPCADLVTALVALRARATLVAASGVTSERPIETLLADQGGSTLGHDEAIVEFSWPIGRAGERSAFGKIGVRTSVAVSRLNAALIICLDGAGAVITEARIAFGSIATSAFQAEDVAGTLRGASIAGDCPEAFISRCAQLVDRSIPSRTSRPYKRLAIRGLAADLWALIGAGASASSATPSGS